MNKSDFNQTGGYPLKTERLQELQTAYSVFNSLGALAGDLTIISGCKTTGTTVSNGFVFIGGELLEFKSGVASPTSRVIIIEAPVNRAFKNGAIKKVHSIRYATFGTASTSWLWTDFKRPFETKNIPQNLLTQLQEISNKEDKTTVTALTQQVTLLEQTISNLQIPKIKIESGQRAVNSWQQGNYYNDFSKNYTDFTPPAGYTMAHLAGFMASISQIKFAGDVNGDDGIWCKHTIDSTKVRVICGSAEMSAASQINYMAIWIKY